MLTVRPTPPLGSIEYQNAVERCKSGPFLTEESIICSQSKNEIIGVPYIIEKELMIGTLQSLSGEIHVRAMAMVAINENTMGKLDIAQAIKEGRFVFAKIKNGVIDEIPLHSYWHEKFFSEDIKDVIVQLKVDGDYFYPENNEDIALAKIVNQIDYLKYIYIAGFEELLKK